MSLVEPTSLPKVAVEFVGVTKDFQVSDGTVQVLKDTSFKIYENNFTIIFGPSGSGKTTILNMLMGLMPPSTGRVLIGGKDLYKLDQDKRAKFRSRFCGAVSQKSNWVNSLSTIENVALPLYLLGKTEEFSNKKAIESLRRVGMEQYKNYNPAKLSGGQQQRISMARATIETPPLFIADEPTGNLDTKNGDDILRLITTFREHMGSTIILVTHNIDYLSLSDNRLYITDGELTQEEGVYMQNIRRKISGSMNGRLTAMRDTGES